MLVQEDLRERKNLSAHCTISMVNYLSCITHDKSLEKFREK
jgi:hypothetical protein